MRQTYTPRRTTMTFKYMKNADGRFVCPHCPFTSGPQSTMHYHLKSKHADEITNSGTAKCENEIKHVCKFCNNRFLQKGLLDLHMHSQHKDELDREAKQFYCPFPNCHVHDLRKGNIISHFCRVHMKDLIDKAFIGADPKKGMQISCSNCKKQFASKPSFNYHVASCIKPSTCHTSYETFQKLNTLEAKTA